MAAMVTKEIKRQRGAVTKFGKKCRRQNSVKRAEDRRRLSGQSRDEWRNTVFGGKKGAEANINPARHIQFVVKKENVLNFHEGTEIVGSFIWKAWLPQNLVSNKFDHIFNFHHTTNTHTTSVGDSSENNVGLLDKYRRSP